MEEWIEGARGPEGSLLGSLRTALRRMREGLWAPSAAECLTCKGQIKGTSFRLGEASDNPLGLCPACFASIPWITRVVCPTCGRAEDCPDCRRGYPRDFVINRSAVRYDPLMKEWLAAFKYRGDERYARVIGTMLHQAYELMKEALPDPEIRFDAVTFVPVSEERLLERGFNQAELASAELARCLRLPARSLLLRTHATAKQSQKTRNARFFDLRKAFALDEAEAQRLLEERHSPSKKTRNNDNRDTCEPLRLLLIDDVYTTGSTMQECSSVLYERLGAEVYGLTWAR
ncbi:ComF family protein [Gorillibacterium sp. CAU 1737]|uniref:ComF family protein n=1 Tax=Gorillibacterium sp. CAU 1737 TaxID=3140362 RepID=UPI0032607BA0